MPQDPEPSEGSNQIRNTPAEEDSLSPKNSEEPPPPDPPIPPEVLDGLPAEQQERVRRFFATSMQVFGPMANPLLNKLEPQHLTDIIALRSKTVDATTSDRKNSRLFNFLALALLVTAALTILLVFAIIGENDLLLEIVKIGGVGLGGFGGGYGFSALRHRN